MLGNSHKKVQIPSLEEIQSERKRIRREAYYRQSLRGTVSVLVVVMATILLQQQKAQLARARTTGVTNSLLRVLSVSTTSLQKTNSSRMQLAKSA